MSEQPEHPVGLVVTDDLARSRVTVGLRALLALPHYIWLFLWTLLAFLAGLLNWLLTLVLGRPPGWLHHFLAAYVKYVTQLYAYLRIAANPYPSFDAPDGYPIDLRIAPPARQKRLTVLFRLPLAIPAIFIDQALGGGFTAGFRRSSFSSFSTNGLGYPLGVAAWLVGVAQRRAPRGVRDTAAWSLGYGAQLWCYLLLLTDRYPNSDPLALLPDVPSREHPILLRSDDDLHRSRLTVLFRLPLSFPHLVWLLLWTLVTVPTVIATWLATLFTGIPPAPLYRFLSRYLRYYVSVYAFLNLVANPFPGFAGAPRSYPPLETEIAPRERQSRWKVAFRLLLAIPAGVIGTACSSLLSLLAVLSWFSALVRGRVPSGMRTAAAFALRYQATTAGYVLLLTDAYPYTGPLRSDAPHERVSAGSTPPSAGGTAETPVEG